VPYIESRSGFAAPAHHGCWAGKAWPSPSWSRTVIWRSGRDVEHPETAAVRGCHNFPCRRMDGELMHRHRGEVIVQPGPRLAPVGRDPDGRTRCPRKRQAGGWRYPRAAPRVDPLGRFAAQGLPRLAEVLRHVHIRLVVIGAMRIKDNIGASFNKAGALDRRHPARAGQAYVARDISPVGARRASPRARPVIGAGIKHVGILGRLGESRGRADLGPRDLRRDGPKIVALLQ